MLRDSTLGYQETTRDTKNNIVCYRYKLQETKLLEIPRALIAPY